MTHRICKSVLPVLAPAVALVLLACQATAEPTIIAPQDPVPIGGFVDVEIQGMAKPESMSYDIEPDTHVRVSAAWGQPTVPILSIQSNAPGKWLLAVACIEGDKTFLRMIPLEVFDPTPPPVDPRPPIDPPVDPPINPGPDTETTAATFVYEKDQHVIPPPVLSALNKLNREQGILATILEADTVDGTGQVPEQYKDDLEEAKKAGLPCLVVSDKDGVVKTVPNPQTEKDVLDAVK